MTQTTTTVNAKQLLGETTAIIQPQCSNEPEGSVAQNRQVFLFDKPF